MEELPDRDNPFDDGRGNDDDDNDAQESFPMTSTSTRERGPRRGGDVEETSFIDTDENTPLLEREYRVSEAWEKIQQKYPNADPNNASFTADLDQFDRVTVRMARKGSKSYPLFKSDGTMNDKLPPTIKKSLGATAEEITKSNETEITRRKEKVKDLESARKEASSSERENIDRNISLQREQIDELERENEAIEERISLRDRVKAIFKKYGFTAFAVLSAVGAVIGVIVSNLKSGLTKLGKGVGNGFKAIGKKLGEILPGMVGAIASFIFKTAGEAIGFLAKNAWLLIVAVVLYFIEQVKNNKKR